MKKDKIGLFVTAYGTPYTESDSESYYSHIRHGRKSSPEALQDFTRELYEEKGIGHLLLHRSTSFRVTWKYYMIMTMSVRLFVMSSVQVITVQKCQTRTYYLSKRTKKSF